MRKLIPFMMYISKVNAYIISYEAVRETKPLTICAAVTDSKNIKEVHLVR